MAKQTGIRMRLNLLHHVRTAGDFWESAIEIGFYKWLGAVIGWGAIVIAVAFAMPQQDQMAVSASLFVLSGLALAFWEWSFPALSAYKWHNLFVLEEQELTSFLIKKNEAQSSLENVKKWISSEEKAFYPDENYPLLRITEKFHGEEHFSFSIEKGEQPHILFISLESFRAAGIPSVDSYRPIDNLTPCFEKLAREGALWKNFYSVSTRSCKALLSTLYGIPAQVGDEIFSHDPGFSLRGLPDILKEKGYLNAYLHNGDIDFDRQHEFLSSHRFDIVHGRHELALAFEKEIERNPQNAWGVHDEYLMRYARNFLVAKEQEKKPCFLYLFTVSNHHPWRLPCGTRVQSFTTQDGISDAPFLQMMHYTDHWLGWLMEEIKKEGLLSKCLIFIYGDHGQPLDEHQHKAQHREGIYEEAVKVPLLILGKGIPQISIDEVSSQIDLLPTVLDLLKIKSLHHSTGRSLKRKKENAEAFFFSPFFPKLQGCRKGSWKLIHDPASDVDELYDLAFDPGEKKNIAEEHSEEVDSFSKQVINRSRDFEELYRRRRFYPSSEAQEYVEIDLRDRPDITDEELNALLQQITPSVLILDGCFRISDHALIKNASRCQQLRRLSIKDSTRITEKGLCALAEHMPHLKTLDLSGCLTLDFSQLQPFWKKVASLKKLALRNQPYLKDEDIELLLQSVKYLERIDAPHSSALTDRTLFALAKNASCLTFFSLHFSHMTEEGLQNLFLQTKALRGFSLEGGNFITDRSLMLCRDLPHLVTATFIDCPQITGDFISAWDRLSLNAIHFVNVLSLADVGLEKCTRHPLRYIYLGNCPAITDRGILSLKEIRSREIHVIDCPQITKQAIHELRQTSQFVFFS